MWTSNVYVDDVHGYTKGLHERWSTIVREGSWQALASEISPVKSAERTVRILELLAAATAPLSVSELHEHTGYPRSSLHALLRTLRELQWVETDSAGSFTVGAHALLVGTSYLDRDPAVPYAYEVLEELRAELGYTIHFARRDGAHVLYLASREARDSTRLVPRVGRRLPLHVTALGQALLAELIPDEVAAIFPEPLERFTEHTITDLNVMENELETVRTRGWSFEREQGTPGIACVAAVVGYRIPATDAVSCSMPVDRARPAEVEKVSAALVRRTQELATTLRRAGIR